MYEDLLVKLSESGARYLVVGAMAMAWHGYPRSTFDLDIMPALDTENLDLVLAVLKLLEYGPRAPVNASDIKNPAIRRQWLDEKNMIAFSFVNKGDSVMAVDILINHDLDFENCYSRRESIVIGTVKAPVISIGDLIELKRKSGRPKDLIDIAALERLL